MKLGEIMSENSLNSQTEINGRIVKGIGGFYYIDSGDTLYECRARGRFRKDGITPLIGDFVTSMIDSASKTGMVTEIHERTNKLIRPPVANITQIAIVFSGTNPKPNLRTVDKLITSAIFAGINPIICINKSDLSDCNEYFDIYNKSGFDTLILSAKDNYNMDKLLTHLIDETTVFAGNSGVGKSSILNQILDDVSLETGEVSGRVERGRHTTRHSELMRLSNNNGYIIDTPGFSSFSVSDLDEKILSTLFPEFEPYAGECKFLDCNHIVEKGCKVLEAIENNLISKSRHESYLEQYKEILDNKEY